MRIVQLITFTFVIAFVQITSAEQPIRLMCGGTASQSYMQKNIEKYEKMAGTKLEITVNPADMIAASLVRDLVDGTLGSPPAIALKQAESRGAPKQNPADYDHTPFLKFFVKLALNPSLNLASVSKDQMEQIFSGKIKNWKEITGQDIPVKVVVAKNFINTNKDVFKFYLKNEATPAGAEEVVDKNGLLRAIKANPGGIGIMPSAESAPDFTPKYINSHVERVTNFVIKKKARPAVRAFFEKIKAEGVTVTD